MLTGSLAGIVVGAALAFAGMAHAAAIPPLPASEPQAHAHEAFSLARAAGITVARGGPFDSLAESPWPETASAASFFAEPVNTTGAEWRFADRGMAFVGGGTAAPAGWWKHKGPPAFDESPFYRSLVGAGEYVLDVGTLSAGAQASPRPSAVPLPGAMWLFGSALLAFMWISGRHRL